MPREIRRCGARRHAGLGVLTGRVDLDVDVQRGSTGRWRGLLERGAPGVELRGFLERVDGRDAEEVGDLRGEGFAFI
jgi:hypothetical protein